MNQFDASVSNLKIPVGNEIFGLILFVYLCKFKEEKEFNLSFEHTEYKWCSIDEAKELLGVKFPKSFIDKLDDFK